MHYDASLLQEHSMTTFALILVPSSNSLDAFPLPGSVYRFLHLPVISSSLSRMINGFYLWQYIITNWLSFKNTAAENSILNNSESIVLLWCPSIIFKGYLLRNIRINPRICLQSHRVYCFLFCWGSVLLSKFSDVSASLSSLGAPWVKELKLCVFFTDWSSVGHRLKVQMWLSYVQLFPIAMILFLFPWDSHLSFECHEIGALY